MDKENMVNKDEERFKATYELMGLSKATNTTAEGLLLKNVSSLLQRLVIKS